MKLYFKASFDPHTLVFRRGPTPKTKPNTFTHNNRRFLEFPQRQIKIDADKGTLINNKVPDSNHYWVNIKDDCYVSAKQKPSRQAFIDFIDSIGDDLDKQIAQVELRE